MDSKKPWQSKTVWLGLISAIAAFFPSVQAWIVANPGIYGVVLSGVFLALRFISGGKIAIGDDKAA